VKALVSANMATRLASANQLALAHCWLVVRTDGAILRATECDTDIPVSGVPAPWDGSAPPLPNLNGTYLAELAGDPSSDRVSNDLSADGFTVDGLLRGPWNMDDLRAGDFRGARVYHFIADWEHPSDGIIPISSADFGESQIGLAAYQMEARRILGRLANEVAEKESPVCLAQLGHNRCKVRLQAPVWSAGSAATLREPLDESSALPGDASLLPFAKLTTVRPTLFMGREFWCEVSGTTGGSEPTWPTTIAATVSDNTATWHAIQARRWEGRLSAVTDQRTLVFTPAAHRTDTGLAIELSATSIGHSLSTSAAAGDAFYFADDGPTAATRVDSGGGTITLAEPYRGSDHIGLGAQSAVLLYTTAIAVSLDAPDDWFGAGLCEFRTGLNVGKRQEVDTWTLSSATLTLKYGFGRTIQTGEHVTLYAGCRHRREDCRDKFANTWNYRGSPDVPTNLVVFKQVRGPSG
jgi:hypothetical protein